MGVCKSKETAVDENALKSTKGVSYHIICLYLRVLYRTRTGTTRQFEIFKISKFLKVISYLKTRENSETSTLLVQR